MGVAKRLLEHQELQRSVAFDIAREAGCIAECEFHEGTFIDQFSDPSDAYRLGNNKFSEGELDGRFDTRKEMTDAIKAAIDESGMECYACSAVFNAR